MGISMKVVRIVCVLGVIGFGIVCASEYYHAYDVSQPAMEESKRALEYNRAQNANIKARAASFYNRLKAAVGFQSQTQPRARVSEYERAYASAPVVPVANQPKRYELVKAYEAEARKDYQYAKQARKTAEEAKEAAYAAKDKAWYAKDKAWSRRDWAYGNPKRYAERDREYQAAVKAWEDRDKAYSQAWSDASKAWSEAADKGSKYKAIKNANQFPGTTRDFNALLREAEARADARRFYPWYKRMSLY